MHNSILNIYIHKPDEGNKVTNGGHREVLLVFWTRARAQNHLEFGCRVLCDHYHPINLIKVIPEHFRPLSISSCGGVYHRICPRAPDICLVINKNRAKRVQPCPFQGVEYRHEGLGFVGIHGEQQWKSFWSSNAIAIFTSIFETLAIKTTTGQNL